MRRTLAFFGFASAFGASVASFTMVPNVASGASTGPKEATFLIPAADGYGVADCLSGANLECGKVVANAWCEAQGYARANTFGPARAEDHTGSIETASAVEDALRPTVIHCVN